MSGRMVSCEENIVRQNSQLLIKKEAGIANPCHMRRKYEVYQFVS